jgi:gas vesicle protein
VSDLQKKLEGLKQQHEPFQKQLDDLNAARAAIGNRHTPLVAKAQAEAKSARDTAAKYYTDYLVVAAKYVNDAIQLRHLAIAPVPADGKFANRPAGVSTTTEFSGEIFENMDETVDIGRAQSLARVGELLPSKHGYVSVVTALTTKPYGGGNQVQAKVFLRFPSQLEDTRARLGFVKMYWDFSKNLRAHEAAAYNAQTQLAAVENEFRSALSQWDSQNGDKLASLQNQVSPLAMQISELNSKLSTIRAERTAKEAVLNKPPSEQASALRQEISTRFAEKRRPLTEELEALEAKLKAEAAP